MKAVASGNPVLDGNGNEIPVLDIVVLNSGSGAVGQTTLKILEQRNFPVSELRALASARSVGKSVTFRGESIAVRFDNPGTYAFFCQPHPWMKATIIAQGESRARPGIAAPSVSGTVESPPSVSPLGALILILVIVGLVFGVGFAGRRGSLEPPPPADVK